MSGLVLPRRVIREKMRKEAQEFNANFFKKAAEAREEQESDRHQPLIDALTASAGQDVVQDVETPIPETLPNPGLWRLLLMPVRQRAFSKSGLIQFAQETLDVQNWTHQLWKVASVGPLVLRGPAYAGFTEEELKPLRPKIGQLWLADPKQPRRFRYQGITYIIVNDDQLWAEVNPNHIDGLECNGFKL